MVHSVRMEAVGPYETLVTYYDTARHTNEESNLHTCSCENLKSQNLLRGITYISGPVIERPWIAGGI